MKIALSLLLALTPIAATSAQQRDFPVAATPVIEDRFPVKPVAFPGGVKAYRDVTYQTLPGYRPQIVDIYVPATPGPHPLVLYIHGGGWQGGAYPPFGCAGRLSQGVGDARGRGIHCRQPRIPAVG